MDNGQRIFGDDVVEQIGASKLVPFESRLLTIFDLTETVFVCLPASVWRRIFPHASDSLTNSGHWAGSTQSKAPADAL